MRPDVARRLRRAAPRRAPLPSGSAEERPGPHGHRLARRWRRPLAALAVASGVAAAPAGAAPLQIRTSSDWNPCKLEEPFRTPLHLLTWLPAGVNAVIVDGWFELTPPPPPVTQAERDAPAERADRFFLRDDRGLGARIALLPVPDFDRDFRSMARTLMGRHIEFTGCLEGDRGAGGYRSTLRFYNYAVIPEEKRERPPREVELASLRPGAFEGQRVLLRGVLAGRRHRALPLSTRMSDSDWVLASGDGAAWMRGHPPRGEGFELDPDDEDDLGRGLAVVGLLAWWRDAPVVHVESVRMTSAPGRSSAAVLFALPLNGRLDAPEQRIEIRFSAAMDASSFEGRVDLVDAAGAPVPARRAYDAEVWSLFVSPESPLAPGAELELRLRDGIVSADGESVRPEPEVPEGLILVRLFRIAGS